MPGLPAAFHHRPGRVLPGSERRNTGGWVIDHSECETPVSFSSYVVGIVQCDCYLRRGIYTPDHVQLSTCNSGLFDDDFCASGRRC